MPAIIYTVQLPNDANGAVFAGVLVNNAGVNEFTAIAGANRRLQNTQAVSDPVVSLTTTGGGGAELIAVNTALATTNTALGAPADASATVLQAGSLSARLRGIQDLINARIPLLSRAAAAASAPVALSTEDLAVMGGTAEVAPATDTATSGLNGRLQRIAQNLTALTRNEDAPHVSGDGGVPSFGVRRDAATQTAGADGDYSTLNTDGSGRLWANSFISSTAALDDLSATGPLFPAAVLYQADASVDEIDNGDLGRARGTVRRVTMTAGDPHMTTLVYNALPTGTAEIAVPIPILGARALEVWITNTTNVAINIELYKYTGVAESKAYEASLAAGAKLFLTPAAGSTGAHASFVPVPSLGFITSASITIAITPAVVATTGALRIDVGRAT